MTQEDLQTELPEAGRGRRLVTRSRKHLDGAKQRTKELGWLLFGRLMMTGGNAILMLLLSVAMLDIRTFGVFATSVGAQLVLSRILLLGVDQGIIRLFTVKSATLASERVIRTGLGSTCLLALPLIVIGFVVAALDLSSIHRLLDPLVVLSIVLGATGTALFDYGYADHLARLEYRAAAMLQASMPTLRLLFVALVAGLSAADSHRSLLVYGVVALGFGLHQVWRIGSTHGVWPGWSSVWGLWRYSRWIGMSDIAMILALQQGLFLLEAHEDAETAVYGFSLTIGMGFFAVYVAFYQAILTRAARLHGLDALPRFLKRVYTMALGLIAVSVPTALVIGWVLPRFLVDWKPELAGFAPTFYMYAAFTMLLILEAPLGVTCQYLLRPQVQLVGMVVRCVAIGSFGLWLVPTGGVVAAGEAQVFGAAIGFLTLAGLVTFAVRSARRAAACVES